MSTAERTENSGLEQYLTFQLAGDEYAFGILRVKEILEYDSITRVPSAPAAVRGVINLRGSVVPVVDLAVSFGLPATEVTRRSCIVIVEVHVAEHRLVMGVLVDEVSQVLELGPADIEPPPPFGARAPVEYLVGLGRLDAKRFVQILDADHLLGSSTLNEPPVPETVLATGA